MFSLFCLTIGVYSSIDAITRLSNDFDIDCKNNLICIRSILMKTFEIREKT